MSELQEKKLQLQNLKLSTDAVNKMTWCSMSALTSTGMYVYISYVCDVCMYFTPSFLLIFFQYLLIAMIGIGLTAMLSECFKVDIHFKLISNNDGGIVIDDVTTSLVCDAEYEEYEICRSFYKNTLVDENNEGILCPKNLKQMITVSDIKAFMRTVSGHVSAFRYTNPKC